MSPASPVSVYDVAALPVCVTSTPSVGEAGAVGPMARRMTTPAKSGSAGFVHDKARFEPVPDATCTPVTTPGGVVSPVATGVAVTGRLGVTRLPACFVAGTSRRKRQAPAVVGR